MDKRGGKESGGCGEESEKQMRRTKSVTKNAMKREMNPDIQHYAGKRERGEGEGEEERENMDEEEEGGKGEKEKEKGKTGPDLGGYLTAPPPVMTSAAPMATSAAFDGYNVPVLKEQPKKKKKKREKEKGKEKGSRKGRGSVVASSVAAESCYAVAKVGEREEEEGEEEEEEEEKKGGKSESDSSSSSSDDSEEEWGHATSRKKNPKDLKEESVTVGQWNLRFQNIVSHIRSLSFADEKTRMQASEELTLLSQDFIHAAKTFGRIIISEVYLPFEQVRA